MNINVRVLKLAKKEDAKDSRPNQNFRSVYREGCHREIIFLKGQRYAVLRSSEKSHGKGYTTHADLSGARIKRAALIARNVPNTVIDCEGNIFRELNGILTLAPRQHLTVINAPITNTFWC